MKRLRKFYQMIGEGQSLKIALKRTLFPYEHKAICMYAIKIMYGSIENRDITHTEIIELYGHTIFKSYTSQTIYIMLFHKKFFFSLLKGIGIIAYFGEYKRHWKNIKKEYNKVLR